LRKTNNEYSFKVRQEVYEAFEQIKLFTKIKNMALKCDIYFKNWKLMNS